jgi:hypothetical protein
MSKQVLPTRQFTRNFLWWLPITSIWILGWGKTTKDFSPSAVETSEISFRVRDAYLFSLPLLMEREPVLTYIKAENSSSGDGYQALKTLLEWNADTYFRHLNALLEGDDEKSSAFRALSSLGVGDGREFSLSKLPREKALAVEAGYVAGQTALLDEINQYRQDPLGSRPTCGLGTVQSVYDRRYR